MYLYVFACILYFVVLSLIVKQNNPFQGGQMFGQQSQYNKDLAFGPDYGGSRYQMPLRPGFGDYEDSLTGQDTTVGRDRRMEFTPTLHERQGGQINTVDAPLSQADLDPEEPNTLTGEGLPHPGNSWSNSRSKSWSQEPGPWSHWSVCTHGSQTQEAVWTRTRACHGW